MNSRLLLILALCGVLASCMPREQDAIVPEQARAYGDGTSSRGEDALLQISDPHDQPPEDSGPPSAQTLPDLVEDPEPTQVALDARLLARFAAQPAELVEIAGDTQFTWSLESSCTTEWGSKVQNGLVKGPYTLNGAVSLNGDLSGHVSAKTWSQFPEAAKKKGCSWKLVDAGQQGKFTEMIKNIAKTDHYATGMKLTGMLYKQGKIIGRLEITKKLKCEYEIWPKCQTYGKNTDRKMRYRKVKKDEMKPFCKDIKMSYRCPKECPYDNNYGNSGWSKCVRDPKSKKTGYSQKMTLSLVPLSDYNSYEFYCEKKKIVPRECTPCKYEFTKWDTCLGGYQKRKKRLINDGDDCKAVDTAHTKNKRAPGDGENWQCKCSPDDFKYCQTYGNSGSPSKTEKCVQKCRQDGKL